MANNVLTGMTPEDLAALRRAVRSLEHPGLAARLTNMVGKPVELIGNVLPASATNAIATATSKGLEVALKVALRTMRHTPHAGSRLLHKALARISHTTECIGVANQRKPLCRHNSSSIRGAPRCRQSVAPTLRSVPYTVADKLECGDTETAVNGEAQLLNLQRKVHAKYDKIEQSDVENGGGRDHCDQKSATDQRDEDEATFASSSSTFGQILPCEVPPKISLVICSRNRAIQLAAMLGKLDLGDLTRNAVEVNLIDSASTDSTREVMLEFKEKNSFPVNIGQADRPGVGLARNVGLKVSSGDVIVFTDDDCYIDADYFTNLSTLWDGQSFEYGGGQILQYDASLDSRIANLTIDRRWGIPPNTSLPPAPYRAPTCFLAAMCFSVQVSSMKICGGPEVTTLKWLRALRCTAFAESFYRC
jgi:hypothetical protein